MKNNGQKLRIWVNCSSTEAATQWKKEEGFFTAQIETDPTKAFARRASALVYDDDQPSLEKLIECKKLIPKHIPILVISRCNTPEIIDGFLSSNVFDYLVKPVDRNILAVKIRRLLHVGQSKERVISIDYPAHTARNQNGDEANLTKTELKILCVLVEAFPNSICPYALRSSVWKGVQVISKTLDVHLFSLRRKLNPLGYRIILTPDHRYKLMKKVITR